jgi:monovalent cation/proton antiporter MnhG/PhaG subunit
MVVNIAAIATWSLLILGMAAFLLTAVGLLVTKDVYDRIQFTYPAATLGVICLCAAVVVEKSATQAGIKAILTGLILLCANPALSHATARAARVRRMGDWRPSDKEKIEIVDGSPE